MLETSTICGPPFGVKTGACLAVLTFVSACATVEPEAEPPSAKIAAPAAPTIATSVPATDPRALAEEARALLAQAETDIQRARGKRALWTRAWESLVLARAANEARDPEGTIRNARRASELAQLGLEQLAYPAVKFPAPPAAQPAGPQSDGGVAPKS